MALGAQRQKVRQWLVAERRVAVVRWSGIAVVDLQGRPTQLGQLLLRDAAALASVLIVVKALLAFALPGGRAVVILHSGYRVCGSGSILCKSYHDQTMAQGTRVQVVMPPAVADQLKASAKAQGRTVSSLAAYIIETALRSPTVDEARAAGR